MELHDTHLNKLKGFWHRAKKFSFVMYLVGFAILIWLILRSGPQNVLSTFLSFNILWLLLAITVQYFVLLFMALRLKNMVKSDLSFFQLLRIYFLGSVFNVAGFVQGAGEVAKVSALKSKNVALTRSGAAMSSEIFYNFLINGIACLLFFILMFRDFYGYLSSIYPDLVHDFVVKLVIVAIMTIIAVVVTIAFLWKRRHVRLYVSRFFENLTFKNFLINSLFSLLAWVLSWAATFFVFKAAGFTVAMPVIIFSSAVSQIVGALSMIPSGLGIREASRAYILTLSGLPLSITGSISVLWRIIGFAAILAGWLILEYIARLQQHRLSPKNEQQKT